MSPSTPIFDDFLDIVDEHYYNTPEYFMQQAHRYDNYDRNGPKIFVGEYAVTRNGGKGNLRAAIGEAAFMTGIERNSDVVAMAAYGDYGPAYIGTAVAYSEGGYETGPRASNVAPEVESVLTDGMKRLLGK